MRISNEQEQKIKDQNGKLKLLSYLGVGRLFFWFHKYAIVLVLAITLGMSSLITTDWYLSNYYVSIEIYGFGLILLAWLSLDGWWNGKCFWFHICLLGLANDCIINMYYAPDYGGNYFVLFKILPTFIALFVALILIFWDEYKDVLRQKIAVRRKNSD